VYEKPRIGEHKDVPLSQLRGMHERSLYYQNPKKKRWLKGYLWREENLWRVDRALIMFIVAVAGAVAGYLNWFK
jgi:hypothetical protein